MKKSLFTFGTTLILLFLTTALSAQQQAKGENKLVAKARQAASDCIDPYIMQGISVVGQVETTGICFVSGELRKVSFFTTVKCHQQPCPKPVSILVATVYFDCSENITLIECTK